MQTIQVGNGEFVSILFIIPIVIDIHCHNFEIFTLVSEIHENIGLVFGIKHLAIVKVLDRKTQNAMMLKLKFTCNLAI